MNVSIKILKPLADYLIGQSNIDSFRDLMVSLRLSANGGFSEDDKNFLNELEGRYAEFSDGLLAEQDLKNVLRLLVGSQLPSTTVSLNPVFLSYTVKDVPVQPETSTANRVNSPVLWPSSGTRNGHIDKPQFEPSHS